MSVLIFQLKNSLNFLLILKIIDLWYLVVPNSKTNKRIIYTIISTKYISFSQKYKLIIKTLHEQLLLIVCMHKCKYYVPE